MEDEKRPLPPVWLSLIPLVVVGILLGLSVFVYDAQPHIALTISAAVAGLLAYLYGYSWKTIQLGFTRSIKKAIPSLIILLIIGMLIGVWMASGIVPALMYYGFSFLTANWFLPSILILCSITAVITGSSWTTAGTIGIAAIGIGQGLDIPAPIIAGCVVSGAFFGDKLSPMSDSTNLTPSVLGVDLYEHIKHMLYTTIPSFIISLIAYTILGFFLAEGATDASEIAQYQEMIRENFAFSPLLLIPPILVITLIYFKTPAIPSLITGVLSGGVMMILVQGQSMGEFFHILYDGFEISTGWEEMDELLSGGGIISMYSVVALAILALAFGGILNQCNMLKSLVKRLARLVHTQGNLVLTTLFTSLFINIFGANQYLSVLIPGQMYETSYRKLGLKLKNLTRALEAGGTLTAPLISWNSSGAFMLTVLAVNPFAYAPFAFICLLTPIIAAIYGYANITMERFDD